MDHDASRQQTHRKILGDILRKELSVYTGFAEVDQLDEILTAWESGRFSFRDGLLTYDVVEATPTGSIPTTSL